MANALRNALDFFSSIGVFDVVLPFMLVFSIVFAIFEKTKVLGMEEIDGHKYTRKNLNAIAAFTISFMVIASSQLVEIITNVSSKSVIVLFASVLFLLLIGSFYKEGEPVFLDGGWKIAFTIIIFISIIGIFLDSVKTKDGTTWLDELGKVSSSSNNEVTATIILLAIVVAFVMFATKDSSSKGSSSHGGGDHH